METTGLPSRIASALATVAHYSPLHQGLSLFEHWLDTVNTVMGARDAAVAPTPKEVIWRKNKARLYRYTRSEKATKKTPVLCIMPLINRAYILDLRPGASFVAYLLSQGHDVYLLDWGEWNDEDRSLNLDLLLTQYMARAVRIVAKEAGGPITMLGYCIGGALATCFVAQHQESLIKNLILLTTPIDFTDAGPFGVWTRPDVFPLELLTSVFPAVPGGYPDVGSKLLQPLPAGMGQFVRLEEKLRESRFDVHGWQAMFRWVNEGVAFPSGCYRQWIGDFYQRNKLARGELVLNGQKVLLSNIRCPLLNVVASTDIIAPRPTTNAILSHVSSTDKQEVVVKGGHVGIVVGKAAALDLWPKVSSWLAARD
ncbi:MAG: alpha/beta fold hydrolase [Polyangia bacterium]